MLLISRQVVGHRNRAVPYAVDAELEVIAFFVVTSDQEFFLIHDVAFDVLPSCR